jgi:hypothetical protein
LFIKFNYLKGFPLNGADEWYRRAVGPGGMDNSSPNRSAEFLAETGFYLRVKLNKKLRSDSK